MNKPIVFSGVQPSGHLHIGNYLGAISQWTGMQKDYQCIFCVVDYHAITVPQDPKILREKIREVAEIYLASGIDPDKSLIFKQSDVKEHTELAWILNCASARVSDLRKMTQFKDKTQKKGEENVSVGLFDYPVLMAADILLYNTNIVPVGEDQAQHVELARTLARRFNQSYGETFIVPEVKIKKEAARIMGLDDPLKKMSKSAESPSNYLALTDSPEEIKKKVMRAVTDSGSEIKFDKINQPAIANLLTMYSALTEESIKDLEKKYHKKGYGDFKKDLADVVIEFLHPFQKRYSKITDKEVNKILEHGAKEAQKIASMTMDKVKERLGIN